MEAGSGWFDRVGWHIRALRERRAFELEHLWVRDRVVGATEPSGIKTVPTGLTLDYKTYILLDPYHH